jgi:hypothetical protein
MYLSMAVIIPGWKINVTFKKILISQVQKEACEINKPLLTIWRFALRKPL